METGDFIGPRILSTGPGVFQQTNIRTLDEAREVLKKYSEFYNTETIKQYMAGDRRTRQFIIMAAREQHLTPTLEGGLDFKKNLTEAMDGYAGSEHTLPIAPLYKDVLTLLRQLGHDVDADAHRAVRRSVGGELLVREQRRRQRSEAQSLHAARRRRAQDAASPGLVGAVAVVVPALRRAGGEDGRRGRPRRHGQPRPAPGTRRAVGDLEHRVGRHAEVRRAARRDDLRRRSDRSREGRRVARGGQARRPAGARQESARRHQEHEHDQVRDEERPHVRRQHAWPRSGRGRSRSRTSGGGRPARRGTARTSTRPWAAGRSRRTDLVAQDDVADRIRDRRVEDRAVGDERVELSALAAGVDGARQIGEQVAVERAPGERRVELRRVDADEARLEAAGDELARPTRASAVPRAETMPRSRADGVGLRDSAARRRERDRRRRRSSAWDARAAASRGRTTPPDRSARSSSSAGARSPAAAGRPRVPAREEGIAARRGC